MNILIVAHVRCGGQYFNRFLSEKYNLEFIHEPRRNIKWGHHYHNSCVKICIHHHDMKDVVEFSKKFDYVFLLSRKNTLEHLQSCIALYRNTTKKNKGNWHTNWIWDDSMWLDKKWVNLAEEGIEDLNKNLQKLSKLLDTEVIMYEDLYYNTESVNLKGLEFKPDTNRKLRKIKERKIF